MYLTIAVLQQFAVHGSGLHLYCIYIYRGTECSSSGPIVSFIYISLSYKVIFLYRYCIKLYIYIYKVIYINILSDINV